MKKFRICTTAVILAITMLCAVSVNAQKKDATRYYQAMFYGEDSAGVLKYGTYFFSTNNNYFPTKFDVKKIIIDGYKMKFSYNDKHLAVIITEFKNKYDFLKWNVK